MHGTAKSLETSSRDYLTGNTRRVSLDMKRPSFSEREKCFCGSKSSTPARTSAQGCIALIASASLSAGPAKMGGSNSIAVRTYSKTLRACSTCNGDRIAFPCKASRAASGKFDCAPLRTTTSSAPSRSAVVTPLCLKFSMLKPKQEQLAVSSYLVPITCYLYLPQNPVKPANKRLSAGRHGN